MSGSGPSKQAGWDGLSFTNIVSGSSQAGPEFGILFDDVAIYETPEGQPPPERYRTALRFLDAMMTRGAEELITQAVDGGFPDSTESEFTVNHVAYHWMLSVLSGRSFEQLDDGHFGTIKRARQAANGDRSDRWKAPLDLVLRLIDGLHCQERNCRHEAELRKLLRGVKALPHGIRDEIREDFQRHLDLLLQDTGQEELQAYIAEVAIDNRMSGNRAERAWKFFEANPERPRKRIVAKPSLSWPALVTAAFGALLGVLAIGLSLNVVLAASVIRVVLPVLLLGGGGFVVYWNGRARLAAQGRLADKEREHGNHGHSRYSASYSFERAQPTPPDSGDKAPDGSADQAAAEQDQVVAEAAQDATEAAQDATEAAQAATEAGQVLTAPPAAAEEEQDATTAKQVVAEAEQAATKDEQGSTQAAQEPTGQEATEAEQVVAKAEQEATGAEQDTTDPEAEATEAAEESTEQESTEQESTEAEQVVAEAEQVLTEAQQVVAEAEQVVVEAEQVLTEAEQAADQARRTIFARVTSRHIDREFGCHAPEDPDEREEWEAKTARIKAAMKEEFRDVYEGAEPGSVNWLITRRVEEIAGKYKDKKLYAYRDELRPSRWATAILFTGMGGLLAGALILLIDTFSLRIVTGLYVLILLALGSVIVRVSRLDVYLVLRHRQPSDKTEAEGRFQKEHGQFEQWKSELQDRPSDAEIARWLDYDKLYLRKIAMDQLGVAGRQLIKHVTLMEAAPGCRGARVIHGPPRYSEYMVTIFLLTEAGVRRLVTHLNFKDGVPSDHVRQSFQYDAIARVGFRELGIRFDGGHEQDAVAPSNGQHPGSESRQAPARPAQRDCKPDEPLALRREFVLSLVSREAIRFSVEHFDVDFRDVSREDPRHLLDLALESSGISSALNVLEPVAAQGRDWVFLEWRLRGRPDLHLVQPPGGSGPDQPPGGSGPDQPPGPYPGQQTSPPDVETTRPDPEDDAA